MPIVAVDEHLVFGIRFRVSRQTPPKSLQKSRYPGLVMATSAIGKRVVRSVGTVPAGANVVAEAS